jgi:hypothetical protein
MLFCIIIENLKMDSFRIGLQSEYKSLQNEMKKHHIKIQHNITD